MADSVITPISWRAAPPRRPPAAAPHPDPSAAAPPTERAGCPVRGAGSRAWGPRRWPAAALPARGRVLGVGLGLCGPPTILFEHRAVTLFLMVLGEQNQRCGVRGLRGEGQIEQDEGVRIPAQADRKQVQHDPCQYEQRLHQQVTAGSEKPCDGFGCPADGLGIQPRGERARCAWGVQTARREGFAHRGPPGLSGAPEGSSSGISTRQSCGNRWSSRSSTVTAPSRWFSSSTTGPHTRL